MGRSFFGVDIASEIASAMPAGDLPGFVLRRVARGGVDPASPTGPNLADTLTDYVVRGACRNYRIDEVNEMMSIKREDLRAMFLAEPLNVLGVTPTTRDFVVYDGVEWVIIDVAIDAAGAKFVCQCRGSRPLGGTPQIPTGLPVTMPFTL